METKIVKRRKLNVARTLALVLFVYLLICLLIYLFKANIKHYEIKGTSYVRDVEILRMADLTDYPSYLLTTNGMVKRKIESNPLVKSARVNHRWNFTLEIIIEENTPLFSLKSNNQVCLADGTLVDDIDTTGLPILLNDTPSSILKKFSQKLANIDKGILYTISEIQYDPSYNKDQKPIDQERFLLTMTDENMVYVTIRKLELLDRYFDLISAKPLNDRGHGVLYLDSDYSTYFRPYAESSEKNE